MTGKGFLIAYASLCVAALIFLHLVRMRLKKWHPALFACMGSPTSDDSSVGHDAWGLQKFVWWGYLSEKKDNILRCFCALASLCQLGVLGLLFFDIWRQFRLT